MQIKNTRSLYRILFGWVALMCLSCTSISTLFQYPQTIVNVGGYKYHKHLLEAERYKRRVDSRCEQYGKSGPFFCLYDLDSQRSLFVYFSNESICIQKGLYKQSRVECKGECNNPFFSYIVEKQAVEEELLRKVPFFLDGREKYLYIFVDTDTVFECQIGGMTSFLSIEFNNPFLSELQRIIDDYALFEQLYSD